MIFFFWELIPNFAICSVADAYPDPDWIRIQCGPWIHNPYGIPIRIRIKEGKNGEGKWKTVNKFHLLKCWMFSFEG
jgi:hypothetical protein